MSLNGYLTSLSPPVDGDSSGRHRGAVTEVQAGVRDRVLYLSAGTDAVDAASLSKAQGTRRYAADHGLRLDRVAAIGDSRTDLPLLTMPGLALSGAPANAQADVKQAVSRLDNGHVCSSEFVRGFLEFYAYAQESGALCIVTDRDGVLLRNGVCPDKPSLETLFRRMGQSGRPSVAILTGSSYGQNLDFVREYSRSLGANSRVREDPYVILAENGALEINVLDAAIRCAHAVPREQFTTLVGDYKRELIARVSRNILPRFGLDWSHEYQDQVAKIFIPDKKTMVTLNIPRQSRDGRDYRRSAEAQELREALLGMMASLAGEMGMPYRVL